MGRRAAGSGMTSYSVFVLPDALQEVKALPGNMKQRVR